MGKVSMPKFCPVCTDSESLVLMDGTRVERSYPPGHRSFYIDRVKGVIYKIGYGSDNDGLTYERMRPADRSFVATVYGWGSFIGCKRRKKGQAHTWVAMEFVDTLSEPINRMLDNGEESKLLSALIKATHDDLLPVLQEYDLEWDNYRNNVGYNWSLRPNLRPVILDLVSAEDYEATD